MIYVLLADGFEEIEALCPVDVLRRAGLAVKTVGITGKTVTGSHGIAVSADILPSEATEPIELLFLPGGMPGSSNLDASPEVDALLTRALTEGAQIAAICAAPFVLGVRGLLKGRRATCYPGFEDRLIGAAYTGAAVETDGVFTTGIGMGAALDFSLRLVEILKDKETAEKIRAGVFAK